MLNPNRDIATERAKLFFQIIKRFLRFIDRSSEIFFVEYDLGIAVSANQVIVRLKPTKAFLEALAALRALNIDLRIIEINHGVVSSEPSR